MAGSTTLPKDRTARELKTLLLAVKRQLREPESDQAFVALGRLALDVIRFGWEVDTVAGTGRETGLSEFERRLAKRVSSAQSQGRTAGGNH